MAFPFDVSQIGLNDYEIANHGEVWNVELATDLVVTMLSVRTMVSRRGLARIHTATHQSRLNICPPWIISLVISLA